MAGLSTQALGDIFELTKQYVSYMLAQQTGVAFGEVTGVDGPGQHVQVQFQPDGNAVISPWLPLLVPLYGVRGMPKKGDQVAVLYAGSVPIVAVGFTYNAVDLVEEPVVTGQFRLTQVTAGHEADVLIDGTTGQIVLNKGTAGIARVGDAVSVSGTATLTGTASLSGTDSAGDTVTVTGPISVSGTVTLTGTVIAGSSTVKA